ncbi:GNAT family N-acetyltransferase [Lentzea guizhouensis]|uniref:GNAT family N-acetyltransferase n=1 Tax=Lentzea guizhouensis TaxID=1586287 RepID=A0A1B2HUB6_9PSEU|nr:GNAT family protein [Lentzea guizhouensis]ANZ41324.1 GNAT family N-acetyltransferase [Lentzea guizhouensis]
MTSFWTGERVRLRGIEPGDWESFRAFDEHTDDMRRAGMIEPPFSAARQREWAQEASLKRPQDDRVRFAVESLDDGRLVGMTSTQEVDHRAGRFSYGITIGNEFHRRGYASDAVRLLLGFMFGERRFHKCESSVNGFNAPSIALHRRLGFTEEGRLRDHEFMAGRHHDVVLFGMTVSEYAERHPFPSEI